MNKKSLNRGKRESGQAMMELAVSLVFLLVLLSAVIDLGWAFYTLISMRDAAQEGAVFGSMCQYPGPDPSNPTYPTIQNRLTSSASAPLDIKDIQSITVQFYDSHGNVVSGRDPDYGDTVKVTLVVNHKIVTPFVGVFIGNNWNYPLTVTVSDTILRQKKLGTGCGS